MPAWVTRVRTGDPTTRRMQHDEASTCRAREPPDPGPAASGPCHIRCQGSRHGVPADRAAASARGGTERPDRAARRRRFRGRERVRRAREHANGRATAARRACVQPVPHHGPVRAHPRRPAQRTQPPLGRHGLHHGERDVRTRAERREAEHQGRTADDAEAERLLDRPVRQVPRGAAVADLARRPVRCLAVGRRRLRDVLRLHRRREQPVLPGPVRRIHARRGGEDAGGGVPPHRGPGRPRHRLGPYPEGARPGEAVLHVLRPGRDPRSAPCAPPSGRTSTPASSPAVGTCNGSRSLARQKQLGVVPADAELTTRPDAIPSWDDMD